MTLRDRQEMTQQDKDDVIRAAEQMIADGVNPRQAYERALVAHGFAPSPLAATPQAMQTSKWWKQPTR